jgi:hypothetical protein
MLTYADIWWGRTEIYNEAIRDLLVSDKEAEGKQYAMRPGTQFTCFTGVQQYYYWRANSRRRQQLWLHVTCFTGATVLILARELEQATAALAACWCLTWPPAK